MTNFLTIFYDLQPNHTPQPTPYDFSKCSAMKNLSFRDASSAAADQHDK